MNLTEYMKFAEVRNVNHLLAHELRSFNDGKPVRRTVRGWLDVVMAGNISDNEALRLKQVRKTRSGGSPADKRDDAIYHSRANKLVRKHDRLAAKDLGLPSLPKPAPAIAQEKIRFIVSDAFLESYEWRVLRMKALKLHGARCQCCGASPKDGAVMNVDHVKPRRHHPELALDLSNLQVLCNPCNHGKGSWDDTDWRNMPFGSTASAGR